MPSITTSPLRGLAALLAAAVLGACSAPGATTGHSAHHSGREAALTMPASGRMADMPAGSGMSGGMTPGAATAEGMDMGRMCAMHREIQNAPPEQRHAVMERHMQQMSPEMRQRQMDMMRQHCQ